MCRVPVTPSNDWEKRRTLHLWVSFRVPHDPPHVLLHRCHWIHSFNEKPSPMKGANSTWPFTLLKTLKSWETDLFGRSRTKVWSFRKGTLWSVNALSRQSWNWSTDPPEAGNYIVKVRACWERKSGKISSTIYGISYRLASCLWRCTLSAGPRMRRLLKLFKRLNSRGARDSS